MAQSYGLCGGSFVALPLLNTSLRSMYLGEMVTLMSAWGLSMHAKLTDNVVETLRVL